MLVSSALLGAGPQRHTASPCSEAAGRRDGGVGFTHSAPLQLWSEGRRHPGVTQQAPWCFLRTGESLGCLSALHLLFGDSVVLLGRTKGLVSLLCPHVTVNTESPCDPGQCGDFSPTASSQFCSGYQLGVLEFDSVSTPSAWDRVMSHRLSTLAPAGGSGQLPDQLSSGRGQGVGPLPASLCSWRSACSSVKQIAASAWEG